MSAPLFLTVRQAAEAVSLHPETIRRYVSAGVLPAVRAGRGDRAKFLIHEDDLAALVRPATVRDVLRAAQPRKETRDV